MNSALNAKPGCAISRTPDRYRTRRLAPWIRRRILGFLPLLLLSSATAQTVSIAPLGQWPGVNRAEPVPHRYATAGQYAFVPAGQGGLVIVDLADPARPRRVGAYQTGGWIRDVAVSGSIACVVEDPYDHPTWTRLPQLLVLDVADPSQPTLLGRYEPDPGGTFAGKLFAVKQAGHYAFVADQGVLSSTGSSYIRGGLHIVDLSDPTAPRRVSGINSGTVNGVVVTGNNAYLAAGQTGLLIADIADPTAPRVVGSANLGGFWVTDVLVSEDRAYVETGVGNGIYIFDISNVRAPRQLGTVPSFNSAAVAAKGPYLVRLDEFPLWWDATPALRVVDCTSPSQPVIVGEYDINHFQDRIWLAMARGDQLHLYGRTSQGNVLETIDLSQSHNPHRIASATFGLGGSAAQDVKVSGHYAYLADQTGLRVLDVLDPLKPQSVAEVLVAPPGGWEIGESEVRRLELHGHLVGIVEDWGVKGGLDRHSRLHLLDISNPAMPSRRGTYEYGGFISDVVLKGNHAFLSTYGVRMNDEFFGGGLEVLDLSSPGDPMLVDIIPTEGLANAIATSGNLLLVGTSAIWNRPSPGGIEVFDISNPSQPRRIGLWESDREWLPFYPRRIIVSGGLAWTLVDSRGLRAIDISNPANPVAVTDYLGGDIAPFAMAGDRLVGGGGLQVFDVSDPTNPSLLGQMHTGAYVPQSAAIAVVDDHVYLASRVKGLQIFRIESVVAGPQLSVELIGKDLLLRWPSTATGFTPESNTDPTSTTWDPVHGTPQVNGDQYELAVPTDGPALFFRLRKP